MDDLVQFLRDRLDEDERAARLALGTNVMARVRRGQPAPRWVPSPEEDAGIWDTDGIPRVKFVWARERDHIVRHDPVRVLREVEAKRRLLGEHQHDGSGACALCALPEDFDDDAEGNRTFSRSAQPWPCTTVKLLALPYADHPDHRDAWRP
ncbi:DUF6221 family protein [Streptomyces anulatus]|uniref:DUF6221 family protein n=1 Tax=Streptomyces anulatus TaxID=1892 RepID=UPI0036A3D952